jgi:hypothetical protein
MLMPQGGMPLGIRFTQLQVLYRLKGPNHKGSRFGFR